MAARRCKWKRCGALIPSTARADADFCKPEHRSAHHNEERREQEATAKRLKRRSEPQSTSSGELRHISEARKRSALKEPTDEPSHAPDLERLRDKAA